MKYFYFAPFLFKNLKKEMKKKKRVEENRHKKKRRDTGEATQHFPIFIEF